jgi:PAS domain S-box-containing protein
VSAGYALFIFLAPLAAGVSIWLAVYSWRQRTAPGASALAWHMSAISAWLIVYIFELLTQTENATLFWDKLSYAVIVVVPVTGFAFALQYTGRQHWVTIPRLLPLCIVPALTVLVIQTNELHHLIWRSYTFIRAGPLLTQRVTAYGPWFWIYVAYAYTLTSITTLLIVAEYFRSFRVYRQQASWVLIGAIAPLVANLVYVFRLIPGLQQDYSPISLALGGIFFAIGIFRYRLFDLRPIARNMLVDSMNDAMIVLDELKRVVDVNPAAQAMVGLPANSLIGQPAASTLPFWIILAEKLTDQQEAQSAIPLAQGGIRHYYDLYVSPLRSWRGRLVGSLIVLHDVTEHQRLIQELDAYAHTVAHDLKNPLANLISYAELLRVALGDQLGREFQEELSRISALSQKLASIVDSLLLLASVRQQEQVTGEPLDMALIVAEAQSRLAVLIEETQAEIVTPEKWPAAVGYAPWVEEIWVNYISNAIKYGENPPHIEIGADPQADGEVLRFWVRDNGSGLTPEQAAQIFTPFVQLNQVKATGYGLGLSIVQRIAEKLGGTVGVESQPGQGSLFFFTLPKATTEEK